MPEGKDNDKAGAGGDSATSSTVGPSRNGDPLIHELVALYETRKPEIAVWHDNVRNLFDRLFLPNVRDKIHSLHSRLKESSHVADKIERKRLEGDVITRENFFDQIEDFAGIRVITLYRNEFPLVHDFIRKMEAEHRYWRIRTCDPYAVFDDDCRLFEQMGLAPKRKRDSLYTSLHYIVTAPSIDFPRCEIQVRTLHVEGWGEVDHKLKYPSRAPSPLAAGALQALMHAATTADWLAQLARSADEVEKQLAVLQKDKTQLLANVKQLEETRAALQQILENEQREKDLLSEEKRRLSEALTNTKQQLDEVTEQLGGKEDLVANVRQLEQTRTNLHDYLDREQENAARLATEKEELSLALAAARKQLSEMSIQLQAVPQATGSSSPYWLGASGSSFVPFQRPEDLSYAVPGLTNTYRMFPTSCQFCGTAQTSLELRQCSNCKRWYCRDCGINPLDKLVSFESGMAIKTPGLCRDCARPPDTHSR